MEYALTRALFPLRQIDTLYRQPQGKRQLRNKGRQQHQGEQQAREGRGQQQREAIDQVTRASGQHQVSFVDSKINERPSEPQQLFRRDTFASPSKKCAVQS